VRRKWRGVVAWRGVINAEAYPGARRRDMLMRCERDDDDEDDMRQ
jgi:hypothetical protein